MSKNPNQNVPASASANAAEELFTVCDFVRYGVTQFNKNGLFYGHGTDNAFDEAVFMTLETLQLPVDSPEPYWNARLTKEERESLAANIHKRAQTRLPASYIVNKAYLQGYPFYVDERVIVPRSFIAELLCDPEGFGPVGDYDSVTRVLDLCTGSGCLAIVAAHLFPNAHIDAVDLSADALDVARRNVEDYGLEDRITLHQGDLFAPLAGHSYDLIITNPPYVDSLGMDHLPPEFEHEPAMALAAGDDGLDIVRRILKDAPAHLNEGGGMICELGRCGPELASACPEHDFVWLETAASQGEVFWIDRDGIAPLSS